MYWVAECKDYAKVASLKEWRYLPSFKGQDIFIKPNLVVPALPSESASTTRVEVVAAAIAHILPDKPRLIRVGDCGFKDHWESTITTTQYDSLSGVQLVGLQKKENYHKFTLIRFPPKGNYLSLFGAKISDFVLECDTIINIAKLKIHKMARMTGTIKNMMGVMTNKGNMHPRCNKDILHKRLRDLYFLLRDRVSFAIIDGIIGSEYAEQGGVPRQSNVMIFADDMWEADVAAAKLMGLNPNGVGYLEYIRRDCNRSFDEIVVPSHLVQNYEEALFYSCSNYEE